MNQYRPDQASPVPNFFLAGDYTQQDFMASIEGAVISGKRCVERVLQRIEHDTIEIEREALAFNP